MYIGTYTTDTASVGVYVGDVDPATGALARLRPVASPTDPTYLTRDLSGRFLFVAHAKLTSDGTVGGAVSSFAIDAATGDLR